MEKIKRITRILFIGVCGILNLIYLTVSTIVVFDKIFNVLLKNEHSISLIKPVQQINNSTGNIVIASMDSIYLFPLYLILAALSLTTAIMFLYFMIEIPKLTAQFYMDGLDRFLFIHKKRTIKFFIMILLPIANFILLKIFSPGDVQTDFIESMIICTISHTGIFIFILFVKAVKENAYMPEERYKALKILTANIFRSGILALAAVFMILPYLLFFKYETDIIWIGVFHIFLISSLISNYKFYNENFTEIFAEMGKEAEE